MLGDVAGEVFDHRADVVAACRDRSRRRRAAGEEAVGEAHRAELEAAGGQHLAALAEQQLGRAAADIDEEDPPVEHRHGLEHAEVDQPRLFDARDHLDADVGFVLGPLEELGRVPRLADGARCHRPHVGVVAGGDARQPGEAATPRSIASSLSSFMSPPLPPAPRRTISRSRVIVS